VISQLEDIFRMHHHKRNSFTVVTMKNTKNLEQQSSAVRGITGKGKETRYTNCGRLLFEVFCIFHCDYCKTIPFMVVHSEYIFQPHPFNATQSRITYEYNPHLYKIIEVRNVLTFLT
jgi:hypothetical protein